MSKVPAIFYFEILFKALVFFFSISIVLMPSFKRLLLGHELFTFLSAILLISVSISKNDIKKIILLFSLLLFCLILLIFKSNYQVAYIYVNLGFFFFILLLIFMNKLKINKIYFDKSIVIVTIFLILHISIASLYFKLDRINSPGYYLINSYYGDSHWFSFYTSIVFFYFRKNLFLTSKFYLFFIELILFACLVLIQSRTGIYVYILLRIIWLPYNNSKTLLIVSILFIFISLLISFYDFGFRSLNFDGSEDSFRLEVFNNGINFLFTNVNTILFGNPFAFEGMKRYYDNFALQISLLYGLPFLILLNFLYLYLYRSFRLFLSFFIILPLTGFLQIPSIALLYFILMKNSMESEQL